MTKIIFWLKKFSDPNFFTQKDLVWFFGVNQPNQNHLNQRLSKLNTLDQSLVLCQNILVVTLTLRTLTISRTSFRLLKTKTRLRSKVFSLESLWFKRFWFGWFIPKNQLDLFGSKKFGSENFLSQKKILVKKNFVPKKCWSKWKFWIER